MRKIEVPIDSVPEFELGDTAVDIQRRREEREAREMEEAQQQQQREFTQMRTMPSSFLGRKQETTTCTAFCNYLALEVEGLE